MPGTSLDREFLQNAILETLVPHAFDIDIEAALTSALEGGAEDIGSILSTIPQRSLLFFDETVPVRIVLRLSNCSENGLRSYLQRLQITLVATVTNPNGTSSEESAPAKEVIFSGTVDDQEDPLVVVNIFEGDDGSGNHVYVTWTIQATLNRPRVRIQHPSVVFSALATLNPPDRSAKRADKDEYLPSLVPASGNVLQPLSGDPHLQSSQPFLPASRLLRVVPATHTEDPMYNVKQQSENLIRIVPAASARIRYSRLNTYSSRPTTIASLDLEVTPYLSCDVIFDKADLTLSDGHIEDLSDLPGLSLPIACHPRDDVTLIYRLTPEYGVEANPSTTAIVNILDISLGAVVQLSDTCKPRLRMHWQTNIDFSTPLNPTFGGPSQAMQRNKRPASLPMTPSGSTVPPGLPSLTRSSFRERAFSIARFGVTISFSGPSHVEVSKPFRWNVFIVNRSTAPRKFAMVVIPRRKRVDPRRHIARPSSSSVASKKDEQVAEAITDESLIHAMQKSAANQEAELIGLSTDVRIGPLLPGTCHSTELILLPLMSGPLHLEAVRFIDLTSNETIDIRDLPDIVAGEKLYS